MESLRRSANRRDVVMVTGGRGLEREFYESLLLPQIMVEGFLGLAPTASGFTLNPVLPRDWPELTITRVRYQDTVFSVRDADDSFDILCC